MSSDGYYCAECGVTSMGADSCLSRGHTLFTRESLMDQCRLAAIELRKMKKHSPYLFPQHARLMNAQRALREATAELAEAQAAWDAFGNHPSVKANGTT